MRITDIITVDKYGNPTGIKWERVNSIPEFSVLQHCEQSKKWHAEGNAYIHTKNVVRAMHRLIESYSSKMEIDPEVAQILIAAALFHDIGKSVTTIFKNNDWHSYGHEVMSEQITRNLLWDEKFQVRESICLLVGAHMEPLFYNKDNWVKKMSSLCGRMSAIKSWVDLRHLILLKIADTEGSKMEDLTRKEADICFLTDLLNHLNFQFCNSLQGIHTMFKSIYDNKQNAKYCVVMIGLPGAGKDYFIENNLKTVLNNNCGISGDFVVVSRDEIRIKMGLCKPGEKYKGNSSEEDMVTEAFNKELVESMSSHDIVVINNINLREKYRKAYKDTLKQFNVKWIYIYVEADSLETNIARRSGMIDKEVFPQLICRFEWPKPEEYHSFCIYTPTYTRCVGVVYQK